MSSAIPKGKILHRCTDLRKIKSSPGRIRTFRGLTTGLFSRFFTVFYLISIIAKKWGIESKHRTLFKAFSRLLSRE